MIIAFQLYFFKFYFIFKLYIIVLVLPNIKMKKLEIELPYDPAIPLLGIHTEETRRERDVYPNVHRSTVYNSQDI